MRTTKCFFHLAIATSFNRAPNILVNGHGYLDVSFYLMERNFIHFFPFLQFNIPMYSPTFNRQTPRSRNVVANRRASECNQSNQSGCPVPEYCPHCLNTNLGVCGKFGSNSYETSTWRDTRSNLMPFDPQEVYVEGDIITVKSYLDTHHNGHMELKACNKGAALCKQEDFDLNELIFIEDMVFEQNHVKMPADPNYPGRGMYAGGQNGVTKWFLFKYKLPMGIYGDEVLLQWKYITANSVSVS
jgi:hypothetical protein